MHSSRFIGRLGGAAVGALLVAVLTGYQPARADEPGVVRLGVVNGDVAIRRGDSSQNLAATVNAPLMASDYLSTGSGDSRAELQLNYGTFLRVSSNTQLRLSQVDQSTNIFQLAAGTVELSELHTVNARTEVDTPSVAVRPSVLGQYRITVDNNGSTIVAVRSGTVELAGASTSQTVPSGETMLISGSASNPQFRSITNVAFDSFDSWNQNRDGYDGNIAGYQYAPQQMVGVPDLSQYGSWNNNPQYGWGWTPNNVQSTWSPYQNGQWVWEPYYGYTWVGNEPWGWAPYHYGTWDNSNSAWTWYPNAGPQYPAAPYPYAGSSYPAGYPSYPQQPYGYGTGTYGYGTSYGSGYPPYASGYPYNYGYPYGTQTSASQMLWAPALVTFLGLTTGQNLSSALMNGLGSSASLGWTPLAPGEQAYPWWGPQQAAWYGYPSSSYPNYQTYGYGQPAYATTNAVATQPAVNSYTTYNVTKICNQEPLYLQSPFSETTLPIRQLWGT